MPAKAFGVKLAHLAHGAFISARDKEVRIGPGCLREGKRQAPVRLERRPLAEFDQVCREALFGLGHPGRP